MLRRPHSAPRPSAPAAVETMLVMPMDYHAMRSANARRALAAGFRRWGAYLLTGLAVLAAGSQAPLAVAAGLLGALALPLWHASLGLAAAAGAAVGNASVSHWVALLGSAAAWSAQVLLLALAALLPLWASRRLWWPPRWAEAERALPLPAVALQRSDARLLPWFTAPVLLLASAGGAALWLNASGARSPSGPLLTGLGLFLAAGLAQRLGGLAMQRTRQKAHDAAHGMPAPWAASPAIGGVTAAAPATARLPEPAPPTAVVAALATETGAAKGAVQGALGKWGMWGASRTGAARLRWQQRHWLWAWVCSPLLRRVARGSARALALSSVAMPALAAGPLIDPAWHGPGLAAMALLGLGATGWLRARMRIEWAGLAEAAKVWPVSPRRREQALDALALGPAALGLGMAAVAMPWAGWRPAFGLLYLSVLGLGCWLQTRPPAADASAHSARWLLLLGMAVAMAFESAPV